MQIRFLFYLFSLFLIPIFFTQKTETHLELNKNWNFREKGEGSFFPAKVPGTIHTDLMHNGTIEDPFYRLNESMVQWVDKKDWEYLNNFELSAIEFAKEHHELRFEGLDTYSTIFLNDSLILETNNMHRTYIVSVNSYLKLGINSLRIVFDSPIRKGLELYDSLDYVIPVSANDQAEKGEVPGGKRVSVFSRKSGYHYGWDWGPRLVTSGIWRPITLVSWNSFRISEMKTTYSLDGSANLRVQLGIESSIDNAYSLVEIKLNDSIVFISDSTEIIKGNQDLICRFTIQNPKQWWPNGMGEQYLYNLKATVKCNGLNDNRIQKIGLRKIDFIPDSNFHFKVNGRSTFMKGVNYIPQDIFLTRVKSKDYKRILSAAANANMNMIRVWGGGVYEKDLFYELCDSLGLLVWQDFMFACAMYPGDDNFLDNVRKEAEDNFSRINKHPCVAIWCGNNENLSAWKRWGWEETAIKEQSVEIAKQIWNSYDTLFHYILPEVVNSNDNTNSFVKKHPLNYYWSSSPSAKQGVPESYQSGDTHYWGVWWGKESFENFNTKISAFMSEYGFQSFPEYSSFKNFASHLDEDMYSQVMKHHQRSSIGNATIEEYMKREYDKPKDFESLLYISQILQADGIRIGIEAHRRNKQKCNGSLYWQLNDCWPGASWSSIDYYGKWKALHYNVKRAFKPVIISHEFIDSNLHVSVVSDLGIDFEGQIEVIFSMFDVDTPIYYIKKKVLLKPNGVQTVLIIPREELSREKNKGYFRLLLKERGRLISSKNVFLLPFKDLKISDPGIEFITELDDIKNRIIVSVRSKNFAKGVYVSSSSKENFSDNYFDLSANEEKKIYLPIFQGQDTKQLIKSIKIRSLWDSF